jgi:hypothetical protein
LGIAIGGASSVSAPALGLSFRRWPRFFGSDTPAQVLDHPAKLSANPGYAVIEPVSSSRVKVSDVPCDIEQQANFAGRAFGHSQEPAEIPVAAALEALRDAGHDRDRRPAQLIPQAEVTGKPADVGQLVHVSNQSPRFPPDRHVLEPLKSSQAESSTPQVAGNCQIRPIGLQSPGPTHHRDQPIAKVPNSDPQYPNPASSRSSIRSLIFDS